MVEYLHWVWVRCDTNSYSPTMEIHQPNEIYFQRRDHEVQSKMMYPKIERKNKNIRCSVLVLTCFPLLMRLVMNLFVSLSLIIANDPPSFSHLTLASGHVLTSFESMKQYGPHFRPPDAQRNGAS